MKHLLLLAALAVAITGCSTFERIWHPRQTEIAVTNAQVPTSEIQGKRVAVQVFLGAQAKRPSAPEESILAANIHAYADTWLSERGFIVEHGPLWRDEEKKDPQLFNDKDQDVHFVAVFRCLYDQRTRHIPGQTYSIPVYQPGTTSTTTYTDAYGNKVLGSRSESPGTIGYRNGYREGYSVDYVDRGIYLMLTHSSHKRERPVSHGTATPFNESHDIFNDQTALKSAITSLLEDSTIASIVPDATQDQPVAEHNAPNRNPAQQAIERGVSRSENDSVSHAGKSGKK